MFSRPLAFILLALGCVTAAAGGAYVANRHNTAEVAVEAAPVPAAAAVSPSTTPAPVAETEAAVSAAKADAPTRITAEKIEPAPAVIARRPELPARKSPNVAPRSPATKRNEPAVARTVPMGGAAPDPAPQPEAPAPYVPASAAPAPAAEPVKPAEVQAETARPVRFEEVILPSASVIGLQLETSVSSERARVEDRVTARVSRDVMAAGRVAIPAGARVVGSVIEVDKGGKVKSPAHIGIRFHTLVLADGSEVPLRTEPIYRDGEPPAASSAKKIGGAAIAGAILGGIMGGGKGAATGAGIGAAGGTAAVMSGDRTVVNMAAGQLLTVKLSAPATITVERRE